MLTADETFYFSQDEMTAMSRKLGREKKPAFDNFL